MDSLLNCIVTVHVITANVSLGAWLIILFIFIIAFLMRLSHYDYDVAIFWVIMNSVLSGFSSCANDQSSQNGNKKVDIAVLSNGGGYTVPRAIRRIEAQTKSNVRAINYEIPNDIRISSLIEEVKKIFGHIDDKGLSDSGTSRAQVFIDLVKSNKIDAPICSGIINKISEAAINLDSIFLPGGENIPKIWYGNSGGVYEDHYRTIVELALIHEARMKGIPLMGVCRGHQIIHVYHGKTLQNNADGYYKNQTFKLIDPEKKGLLAPLFRQTVVGLVMHHQGVSIEEAQNGAGDLEPLTVADGLVKAAESKYSAAAPVIATQFHPEMYEPGDNGSLSENNGTFFKVLHESAVVRKNKKEGITPEALTLAREELKNPQERSEKSK